MRERWEIHAASITILLDILFMLEWSRPMPVVSNALHSEISNAVLVQNRGNKAQPNLCLWIIRWYTVYWSVISPLDLTYTNTTKITWFSHHIGPLGQKKVVELVLQEEAPTFAINGLLPSAPSAINNLLEVIRTSVMWIKDEKSTITTDFVVINSQKGIRQHSTTCIRCPYRKRSIQEYVLFMQQIWSIYFCQIWLIFWSSIIVYPEG